MILPSSRNRTLLLNRTDGMNNDNWLDRLAALRSAMGPDTTPEPENDTPADEAPAQRGRLDIIFERKGRAGKTATIVAGFTISDEEIEALASDMKRALGAGGSARGGEILIQGDRRQGVLRFLTGRGFKARII